MRYAWLCYTLMYACALTASGMIAGAISSSYEGFPANTGKYIVAGLLFTVGAVWMAFCGSSAEESSWYPLRLRDIQTTS